MRRGLVVFTRTTGYRHDSIAAGVRALRQLAPVCEATEDPARLVQLLGDARFGAVVFLNTSGEVLDPAQQAGFERFVRAGGGFVGIHSACDTGYAWRFYGGLVGAYFSSHPHVQAATVRPTSGAAWTRVDEWYDFDVNARARPGLHVLAVVDEASYEGGKMGADHPIAWQHAYEGGRAFYTGLGHTEDGFADARYVEQLRAGIAYALVD